MPRNPGSKALHKMGSHRLGDCLINWKLSKTHLAGLRAKPVNVVLQYFDKFSNMITIANSVVYLYSQREHFFTFGF